MSNHLAVDAGGTSTRAVLVDQTGRCLGYGRAGGGNPLSSGPAAAAESLASATNQALALARTTEVAAVASVTIAMAGGSTHLAADDPRNDTIAAALRGCGITAPFAIRSDLLAMFCAGTAALDGYAMVAGTGAAAIRVRDGDVERVVDGMGWLIGDGGSGFWIGHEVARAVVAHLDGRGPATAMTTTALDILGITSDTAADDPSDAARHPLLQVLVDVLYDDRPVRLARLAPVAFAHPDDPAAQAIVTAAAAELTTSVDAVVAATVDGPLVLGGSVLLHQEAVTSAVEAAFRGHGRTGPAVLVAEGTLGAAVLALRDAGVTVDDDVFARLESSTPGPAG